MRRAGFGHLLFASLTIAALAGCAVPRLGSSLPSGSSPAHARLLAHGEPLGCSASKASIPKTYVLFSSDGNVTQQSYTAIDGFWAKGVVFPMPSPSPQPSAPVTPTQPTYLYTGTYRLAHTGQTGCAFLETTLSGKPLPDSSNNASLSGQPNFGTRNVAFDGGKMSGSLLIGALHLTTSGGHASLVLMLGERVYDTGSLTLTSRRINRGP
jgi:hypothetical protein